LSFCVYTKHFFDQGALLINAPCQWRIIEHATGSVRCSFFFVAELIALMSFAFLRRMGVGKVLQSWGRLGAGERFVLGVKNTFWR
jgi:hypothetical protein